MEAVEEMEESKGIREHILCPQVVIGRDLRRLAGLGRAGCRSRVQTCVPAGLRVEAGEATELEGTKTIRADVVRCTAIQGQQ